jgi:hypothetical protein
VLRWGINLIAAVLEAKVAVVMEGLVALRHEVGKA